MISYSREVFYYETDKMGIVHHSNYVRYLEEARIHAMDFLGYNFKSIEDTGLVSPVVSVSVRYIHPLRFGDTFEVRVFAGRISAAQFGMEYEIWCDDLLCAKGESSHCFTGEGGRPVNIRKRLGGFVDALREHKK